MDRIELASVRLEGKFGDEWVLVEVSAGWGAGGRVRVGSLNGDEGLSERALLAVCAVLVPAAKRLLETGFSVEGVE